MVMGGALLPGYYWVTHGDSPDFGTQQRDGPLPAPVDKSQAPVSADLSGKLFYGNQPGGASPIPTGFIQPSRSVNVAQKDTGLAPETKTHRSPIDAINSIILNAKREIGSILGRPKL